MARRQEPRLLRAPVVEPHDIIFLGTQGPSAVFYYRCMLPARALNASYCAVSPSQEGNTWPQVRWRSGLIQPRTPGQIPQSAKPDLGNYKVVIISQPPGDGYLTLIEKLREAGKVVLFEVDDYLHGIHEKRDHQHAKHFDRKLLAKYEACMSAASGLICSTPFIAERYAEFNEHVHICRNGLDLGRYDLTCPPRRTINLGWAGATGHTEAILPWLQGIGDIMSRREDVSFVTIGANYADFWRFSFRDRAVSIPWCTIEQYPGAMTMFDIALAPARDETWYKGKSDLRFLEAGALGIPCVGDAGVYSSIEHGKTGFKVESAEQAIECIDILVEDEDRRREMGAAAKRYVWNERSIHITAQDWRQAIEEHTR